MTDWSREEADAYFESGGTVQPGAERPVVVYVPELEQTRTELTRAKAELEATRLELQLAIDTHAAEKAALEERLRTAEAAARPQHEQEVASAPASAPASP